ncbi:hypothetical protein SCHPADRAFT_887532 [Schizopora paradoxa]|uniref:Uncharacterized protein n=1 Tax=Schizopora paradoxa TaxID=27342 RepID=A0A0H2RXE3_9AGAM|nr:hypothetical protein SCHPADRAFT_887532 [Schizopora paradoxa]
MATLRSIAFVIVLVVLALFAPSTFALKASLSKRDVWAPRILEPEAGTVWRVGEEVNVTWSTANPPKQITNEKGLVALRTPHGFVAGRGGLGEPLAANFSLFDGHVLVQVPELPAGDDYSVVLFGDSGNESPLFKIVNPFMAVAAVGI